MLQPRFSARLLCPAHYRVGGMMMRVWRLSVAYIGPKSRKDRPHRKTKIGTEVAHVTRDSDTTFIKVKRSKVNLQGAGALFWWPPAQLIDGRLLREYGSTNTYTRPVGLPRGSLGASASLHKEACAGLRTYLRYNEIYCHTYVTHRFDCFLFNTGLRWQRVKVLGVTQHLWSQGGEGAIYMYIEILWY